MADNGWSDGICPAEPSLPKLLLLSLERVGVVDPPTGSTTSEAPFGVT
jgi:hypothetical protein